MDKFLKTLAIIVSGFFLSLISMNTVFAQAETAQTGEALVEDVTAQDAEATVTLEINPETYLIFVHEDCSHCAAVEAFVDEYGIQDRVTYKQLKDNDENMALLEDYWNQFKIEGDMGWPVLVKLGDEDSYAIGDTPIMDVLATDFSLDYQVSDTNTSTDGSTDETARDTTGDKIFFYLGGIVVLGLVGYGLYSILIED